MLGFFTILVCLLPRAWINCSLFSGNVVVDDEGQYWLLVIRLVELFSRCALVVEQRIMGAILRHNLATGSVSLESK